jgi:L-fuculose-phosphate aldolase
MGFYEDLAEGREEVAYFMRRLYNRGLSSSSAGNVSRRIGDRVLITPAALDKGETRADQIAVVELDGTSLTPQLKPTCELDLHLGVYRNRPDVMAVTHAHPPFGTTFASSGKEIMLSLTIETYALVRKIAWAEFSLAGSAKLAEDTAQALLHANVCLMRNHGVITVGNSLFKAFDLLEVTEMAAKMTWLANSMQSARPLGPTDLALIDNA